MHHQAIWGSLAGVVALGVVVAAASPLRATTMAMPEDAAGMACNAFGCNVYRKLVATEKANVFISPYSLESALVMTFLGSDGETAKQMRQTLCLPELREIDTPAPKLPPQAQNVPNGMMVGMGSGPVLMPMSYVTDGFKKLAAGMKGSGNPADKSRPGLTLTSVNALWGEKSHQFQKTYLDLTHDVFGSELTPLDFQGDPEGARAKINEAVAEQTKEKIKELMPPGSVKGNTKLVLTNAVYFKGAWALPFKPENTVAETFNLYTEPPADPNQLGGPNPGNLMPMQAPFMMQTARFKYAKTGDATVVELNYAGAGQPGETKMVVIMPDDEGKRTAMEKNLQPSTLWQEEGATKLTRVELHLPKFKFSTPTYDLGKQLAAMGMSDAFEAGKADFSKIDGTTSLFIGGVYHKAFVDVNEEGTEAAAATAVGIMTMSERVDPPAVVVKIDRPFLFYIQKGVTILFMGRVTMPEK